MKAFCTSHFWSLAAAAGIMMVLSGCGGKFQCGRPECVSQGASTPVYTESTPVYTESAPVYTSSYEDTSSYTPPHQEPCTPVYSLTPPGSYDGDECVRVCYRERNKCIEEKQHRTETCEHYNRMARLEFGRCIASGATNCYNSVKDNECSQPDLEQCDTELRYCYTSCGGTVTNSCDEKDSYSSGDKGYEDTYYSH